MRHLLIAGAASAMALAGSAHAAFVDFVAYAAGNEMGVADGFSDNFDGVNITFSSLSPSPQRYYAYFDDLSSGKPAGLGVCEILEAGPGSECADTTDDNIRSGDAVTLAFDSELDISNLSFTDMDHNDLNGNDMNTLLIALNGGAFVSYTFADAVAAVFTGVTSIRFGFDDADGLEYYVNSFSAVPLPAAAPLLLAGLAGLGFASRRRKANA